MVVATETVSEAGSVERTYMSLEDAAHAVGRHPQTLLRWFAAGEFTPQEMWQLEVARGKGKAWCVELAAVRRVALAHWTPPPAKPALTLALPPLALPRGRDAAPRAVGRASAVRAPAVTVRRAHAADPREGVRAAAAAAALKRPEPKLPAELRGIQEIMTAHRMGNSRRWWHSAVRRGELVIEEGHWQDGLRHVQYALCPEGQRTFGMLFADRVQECADAACLVCQGVCEERGGLGGVEQGALGEQGEQQGEQQGEHLAGAAGVSGPAGTTG